LDGLTPEQLHESLAGRYSAEAIDNAIDVLHYWTEMDDLDEPIRLSALADPGRIVALN